MWLQGLSEALLKAGACYKYDLSLPIEKMYNLVQEMRERLGNHKLCMVVFHIMKWYFPSNLRDKMYTL